MAYRYALIGLGFISSRHRKAIQDVGGKIVCTCDIDPLKGADFTDWVQMIHSDSFKDVDVVVVCTPNYTHSAIVRECLLLGKKVICEKPLTIFRDTDGLDGVFTMLQLRYNQEVIELKDSLTGNDEISITVRVYREPEYWNSWKGKPELSGGVLYNMGIHYIDLLIHLLGNPMKIISSHHENLVAWGEVEFERGTGKYLIELMKEKGPTVRDMIVNGRHINLEGATIPLTGEKDYINLHTQVYKAFVRGKGIPLSESRKSLDLVHKLRQ